MLSQEQKTILKQQNAIEELKKREERYMYYGIYEAYCANKLNIQSLEYTKLNPKQHFMFKRVLHGLNVYSKEEVTKMHWDKKRRIRKVWKRGQNTINEWKQVIVNQRSNDILKLTFGNKSPLINNILDVPVTEVDTKYINRTRLKDLGLTYEDLILRFITVGLLPKNFLTVK